MNGWNYDCYMPSTCISGTMNEVLQIIEERKELGVSDWKAVTEWVLKATINEEHAANQFGKLDIGNDWVRIHAASEARFFSWLDGYCKQAKQFIGNNGCHNVRVVLSGGAMVYDHRFKRCESVFSELLPECDIINQSFTDNT
jgi:hypothetical protein